MAILDAQGATLSIADADGNPVLIECIKSFSETGGTSAEIDITCLTSTAKEFRQGLQDFGSLTVELFRDPNDPGQKEMDSARALQSTRQFVLTLESGDVATFDGFVKSLTMAGAVDGVLTGTAEIRITGEIVWS